MKRQRDYKVHKPSKKRKRVGDYQKGRELARTPKQELKAFDVTTTNTAVVAVAGGPVSVCLNTPVNGAELYQRVGRKIYMKSLHFRGVFVPSAAAIEQYARLIIYYDSQPNTALPAIATILQDSTAGAATTWQSEINLINRQRFKILRDYQVMLGATNAGFTTEIVPDPIVSSYNVDMFIKLKGLESIFNATNGGTIADVASGALNFVLVGSAAADGNWDLQWSSRLRYYD